MITVGRRLEREAGAREPEKGPVSVNRLQPAPVCYYAAGRCS